MKIPLVHKLQNKIKIFGWEPYYDNVNYTIHADNSFSLSAETKDKKVTYRSKDKFEFPKDIFTNLISDKVCGGIPSTDLDLESISIELEYFNQLNRFYYHENVFVGTIEKINMISMNTVVIEQHGKLIYPVPESPFHDIFKEHPIYFKKQYFKEYKKLRVGFYKAQHEKKLLIEPR